MHIQPKKASQNSETLNLCPFYQCNVSTLTSSRIYISTNIVRDGHFIAGESLSPQVFFYSTFLMSFKMLLTKRSCHKSKPKMPKKSSLKKCFWQCESLSFSGTEEWTTLLGRTGRTCLMLWSFRPTNLVSLMTGESKCVCGLYYVHAVSLLSH